MIKNILFLLGTLTSLNALADLSIADFENENRLNRLMPIF